MGKFRMVERKAIRTNEYKRTLSRFCKLGIWSIAYFLLFFWNSLTSPVESSPIVTVGDEDLQSHVVPSWVFFEAGEGERNCTMPGSTNFPADLFTQAQRRQGAVVVHFLASFYIFYTLLLICDDYFVPSVESICRELKIPSDVAGATFMAISTSAPELFTNVIGTFVTQGDLGIGTIVGSAVFNILAVTTVCGIGSAWTLEKLKSSDGRNGIPLEWWPLTRDTIFYVAAISSVLIVLMDNRVQWYEALCMLALYSLYITVLCTNSWWKRKMEALIFKCRGMYCKEERKKVHHRISVSVTLPKAMENTPLLFKETERSITRSVRIDEGSGSELSLSSNDFDELLISKALLRSASQCIEKVDYGVFTLPRGESWLMWLEWIVSWPIRLALYITIPDCREYKYRKWYPVTLVLCVIWIGCLCYVMSWMMTIIGETLGIPESVTGLTILAAGTSIPEVFSSIIVARQGLGSMAFGSSIGSNTFDILFCLGLPWFIKGVIVAFDDVNYIQIQSTGLEFSVMLMVATMLLLYIVILANGFLLDKKVGFTGLILYLIFIVIAILMEMNVFFPVNLPQCTQ